MLIHTPIVQHSVAVAEPADYQCARCGRTFGLAVEEFRVFDHQAEAFLGWDCGSTLRGLLQLASWGNGQGAGDADVAPLGLE